MVVHVHDMKYFEIFSIYRNVAAMIFDVLFYYN